MLCVKFSKTPIKIQRDGVKLQADYKAAIKLSEMIVQIGVTYPVKIDREPHTRDTL